MKEKLKKQVKGITLIALVVTIIVLLILAGVAINLTIGQNGIFTRAQNAVDESKTASDIEQLQMSAAGALKTDGTVDRELLNSSLPSDFVYEHGSYVNTKSKNEYKISDLGEVTKVSEELDLLEKFLLGENKDGRKIKEFVDESFQIIPDDSIIENANEKIKIVMTGNSNSFSDNGKKQYALITYNNKMYRVYTTDDVYDEVLEYVTESVDLVYSPNGDEGKKVLYSYDGSDENKKEWTILYDDGEYIEILSPEAIGTGYAIGDSGNIENSINDYNNAIKNLNEECEKMITNTNTISVRSVGSNPSNPNSKNTKKIESEILGEYNQKCDKGDMNFESDLARMCYYEIQNIPEEKYWLASKGVSVNDDKNHFNFHIRIIDGGFLKGSGYAIWGISQDNIKWSHTKTCKVRPIVKVKKSEISIIE